MSKHISEKRVRAIVAEEIERAFTLRHYHEEGRQLRTALEARELELGKLKRQPASAQAKDAPDA